MHRADADYKILSGQFLITGNENERLGAFMNQLVDTFPFITFCSFNELHRGMRTQQPTTESLSSNRLILAVPFLVTTNRVNVMRYVISDDNEESDRTTLGIMWLMYMFTI